MKVPPHYINVPLEKFTAEIAKYTEECRQIVGYRDDADWECPYHVHGESFRESTGQPNKVGGLRCYHCMVKEAHAWHSRGLPIPVPSYVGKPKSDTPSAKSETKNPSEE
jgi:hypothetical protein